MMIYRDEIHDTDTDVTAVTDAEDQLQLGLQFDVLHTQMRGMSNCRES